MEIFILYAIFTYLFTLGSIADGISSRDVYYLMFAPLTFPILMGVNFSDNVKDKE